jgi:hypothetical protein
MAAMPNRSENDLTVDERQRLEVAHARLRAAVQNYAPFIGSDLAEGMAVHNVEAVAQAQSEVEAAEEELWHLREELLGWTRPPWATRATLVADWFSDDDAVYDAIDTPTP